MEREQVAMLRVSEIKKLYDEGKLNKTFVRDLAYYGFITPAVYEQIIRKTHKEDR